MQKITEHLTPEQIAICADAVNQGKFDQLPGNLRHHLMECDQCAHEMIVVAEMSSDKENSLSTAKRFVEDIRKKSRRNFNRKLLLGIAASLTVVVVALILSFPGVFGPKQEQVAEQQTAEQEKSTPLENQIPKDTIRNADTGGNGKPAEEKRSVEKENSHIINDMDGEKEMLAMYEPDPELEKLYDSMQGTFRGESMEVKTPRELHLTKCQKLEWSNESGQTVFVEIFDNKGNEILAEETTDKTYSIPDLSPGLYYWKLIDADFELQFVGKIIVKD
ncbi:MAG: T9SS type A sorting domain-containing protein [Bacteroidales bacterium]